MQTFEFDVLGHLFVLDYLSDDLSNTKIKKILLFLFYVSCICIPIFSIPFEQWSALLDDLRVLILIFDDFPQDCDNDTLTF